MERILDLKLSEAVDMFVRYKWKFYEVRDDCIKVEVPRSQDTLVVLLESSDDVEYALRAEGFIKQIKEWTN